jgi:hypothetical protein
MTLRPSNAMRKQFMGHEVNKIRRGGVWWKLTQMVKVAKQAILKSRNTNFYAYDTRNNLM